VAEVAIIGGGLGGLTAAIALARRGVRIDALAHFDAHMTPFHGIMSWGRLFDPWSEPGWIGSRAAEAVENPCRTTNAAPVAAMAAAAVKYLRFMVDPIVLFRFELLDGTERQQGNSNSNNIGEHRDLGGRRRPALHASGGSRHRPLQQARHLRGARRLSWWGRALRTARELEPY
jgi:glycine/D-amino acid oxidase-like deaminating enzyme